MYIIVVGGGKVGYYLTKELLEQGHEALLIERKPERVDQIIEELGNVALKGDGCEVATLEDAGARRCDVLVTATGDDEDNLVSCQLARSHFGVPRTIARVNNPKNDRIFRVLGVDVTVSGTNLLMSMIEHEMPRRALLHLLAIKHMGVEIVEAVLAPGAPAVGKSLSDLQLPENSSIAAVMRNGLFKIPSGQLVLEEGDEVIALCKSEKESDLRTALLGAS
ncbi:MAG TPA: TrkA family potassium uptake protein [Chloroflexota bacterium]|nr:TrkA family potassium uptake protein [Chloroflexota bacterium]